MSHRKIMKKTVSFSKNATNVFFHILTKCNLRCRHCYINPAQQGENTLDISTIKAWLGAFAGKSAETNVIFLGGEPTLHPDLPAAVSAAKELGCSSITIDTNGYLFHDVISKVRPDDVDYFSFSLDGPSRGVNDNIRGEGCYDRCVAGIEEAVKRGFGTSLIYTVSSANIHELCKMAPLLADLGIERFFIQVIGIRGEWASAGNESLQVSKSEWTGIVPEAAREIAEKGIVVSYPKVYLNTDEKFECAGLCAENYFIFPNGRVYRCPLCEDYPLHGMIFRGDRLENTPKINETDLFALNVPEGCVMNKLVQPSNLVYKADGTPDYRIACCMLKEEIRSG